MNMQETKHSFLDKAIAVAQIVGQHLEITKNIQGEYLVSIPWTWRKRSPESSTMSGFFGASFSLETACMKMCQEASGILVVRAPGCPEKEVPMVVL